MRAFVLSGLIVGLCQALPAPAQQPKDAPKATAKSDAKDTTAADLTRTKLLKVKVTVEYANVPLGEVLKEFAHQVDVQAEQPVMWAYGKDFPFSQRVTFTAKNVPLETAIDQLLSKAGGGLGYVVVSKDGDKYDGWVRLTTTGERGSEKPPEPAATPEDEAAAGERIALAKKHLEAGKPANAKPLLEIVIRKYPTTKAAAEAKELLAKIEKDK